MPPNDSALQSKRPARVIAEELADLGVAQAQLPAQIVFDLGHEDAGANEVAPVRRPQGHVFTHDDSPAAHCVGARPETGRGGGIGGHDCPRTTGQLQIIL